jgi:hypothetical protein
MTIMIVELHPDYWYPNLIGKTVELLPDAPHTDTEWAFWKFETKKGDVAWGYVHKNLCQIVKPKSK